MSRDRTLLAIAVLLGVILLAGPVAPRWTLFLLTVAIAKGLVALGPT